MREGWNNVKLADVCRLINGRTYKKNELLLSGGYPVLRVGNFFTNQTWYYSDLELDSDKYCDNGDLLYAWSASFGPRIWKGGKVIFHYHIWKVEFDRSRIDRQFLYYWFDWDKEKIKTEQGVGTTMLHVTKGAMEQRKVELPSLPEQKRIVAILDEAFAGIANAVANTEKNLANTRELFESYLNGVFRQRGKGWKRINFSCAVSTVRPPRKIQRKEFKESGPFPIVSQERGKVNGRWSRPEDVIRVDEPLVIFGDHTRVFKYIDFDFVAGADGVKILRPATFLHAKYLYYFAQSLPLKGLGYARHYRILKDMDVWYPEDVFQQEAISIQLDGLVEDLNRLQAVYSQKLDALAELKQSLLQKAFSGELTANKEVSKAFDNKEEVA